MPAVFHAADPVMPGKTTLIIGKELGSAPFMEIVRLPDGRRGKPEEIQSAFNGKK